MKCCALSFVLLGRWNFVVLVLVIKIDNEIDILYVRILLVWLIRILYIGRNKILNDSVNCIYIGTKRNY